MGTLLARFPVLVPCVALGVGVAGCSAVSPVAPAEPAAVSSAAVKPDPALSMNANKWELMFSPGMPPRPSDAGVGWQFVFPNADGVHYLTTKHGPKSASQSIMAVIAVETTGTPYFEYRTEPFNTCDTPSTVRLFFQRKGDNLSGEGPFEFYRWWSTTAAYVLGPGGAVLIGDLTNPSQWISVLGQRGDVNEPMFRAALADLENVGFTFGGGCFFGHGVYVTPGTDGAVFKGIAFSVR